MNWLGPEIIWNLTDFLLIVNSIVSTIIYIDNVSDVLRPATVARLISVFYSL